MRAGRLVFGGGLLTLALSWLGVAVPAAVARLDAQIAALDPEALPTSLVIRARDGVVVDVDHAEHRQPVPLADLAPVTLAAFVAAEDQRFWHHEGVDPKAVARAAWANVVAGGVAEGGSTITQQLVKNLLVGSKRTLGRKVQEALLAWRLERTWSKAEILELYLNYVYLGGGNHGLDAAAEDLFGVAARDIDPGQAALLASGVRAPSRHWPRTDPDGARIRRDRVLSAMAAQGQLTVGEALRWQAEPLGIAAAPESEAQAYATEARRTLARALGPARYKHGLRATLALDREVQRWSEQAVGRALVSLEADQGLLGPVAVLESDQWRPFLRSAPGLDHGGDGHPLYPQPGDCFLAVWQAESGFRTSNLVFRLATGEAERLVRDVDGPGPGSFSQVVQPAEVYRVCLVDGDRVRLSGGPWAQGAAVVLNHMTGHVLALVGGREDHLGGLVRATRSRRQPGSSFKLFVWAAALADGHAAARRLPGARPQLSGLWSSRHSLRRALARSDNDTATWLAARVGHDRVLALAAEMGVDTRLVDHETLAMGTRELSLMDNALGYATVARGGLSLDPILVQRVDDWHGQPVAMPSPAPPRRVLAPEVAAELDQALQQVVRTGTARTAWDPDRARAGKTGTTDGPSDAWFVGYSGDHTVAVWIGSDQRVPLGPDATGASLALPVWVEIIQALEAR